MSSPIESARIVFARRLRRAREALSLSQEALASRAGLHRTYVGAVERAESNISVDNMEKLARAVGQPLHELLRGDTP
ncbi:MAG TPA: helix-turn-helix transcriptional regulator [Longimicrobiaceae bacterium]|nr:helix-turn-helix transcriptional regulator [Longimicrobiaceae bacterium]